MATENDDADVSDGVDAVAAGDAPLVLPAHVEPANTSQAPKGGSKLSGTGEVRTEGCWEKQAFIPEKIMKKLARVARLKYEDGHPSGGGGLCLGIEGTKPRKRALMLLGILVSRIGDGSADKAVTDAGTTWLDVMWWQENEEYMKLWEAALKYRRTVYATRLEDRLWDRSMNGFEADEAKCTREGVVVAQVHKFNDNLSVSMLKGLGYLGKDSGVKPPVGGKKGKPEPVEGNEDGDGNPLPRPDTVLFADRKTAFAAMGGPKGPAAKPPAGKE